MGSKILLLLNFIRIFSLEISKIPSVDTPPQGSSVAAVVYYEAKNQLIIFGGYIIETNEYLSKLYSFSLSNASWSEIHPESNFSPPGITIANLAIYSNTLYVFYGQKDTGCSADVFSFNLVSLAWKIEYLQGDIINGRYKNAFTTFKKNNTDYIAIFGGLTHLGKSNELFL